ncbi:putative inorganic carbon transporter subunit DabA [Gemmatimonas sp.]|uniref:putative inorganic carbon transporter subunit DabA n=1 Tax=Gemmatimonas sp. TaxID=1962908 RepID=UPI00286B80F7|nr:putative inorganic carbon transporter subunit DabA [Gemmatimonas sp.]
MSASAHHGSADAHEADPVSRALAAAHGILPDQGPIGVFIHHNTLHAFQHLPFHEGVQAGAEVLGARPYLSLREFRAALAVGRVAESDVRHEIGRALGARAHDTVLPGLSRDELWTQLSLTDADSDDAPALAYLLRSGTAAPSRNPAFWAACIERVSRGPRLIPTDTRKRERHRDILMALGHSDTDVAVHGELIRLSSGFLDQGQAQVSAPNREKGFLRAVSAGYADGASPPRACRGVDDDMRTVFSSNESPASVIRRLLTQLGVDGDAVEPFLLATAVALPGWTGMFARLQRHPEEHTDDAAVSLEEFLAV